MVNKSLVKYIQKYHSQGYSVSTLKNFLIKQGYSENEVTEALSYSYTTGHHDTKMFYIIASVIGAIIFVALFILLFSFFSEPEIDYNAKIFANFVEIEKGDDFNFKIYVENNGDDVPLSIRYELKYDGSLETQSSDLFEKEVKEKIYTVKPQRLGNYVLTAFVRYNDYERLDTFSFKVKAVCGDGFCENNEDCPQDCEIPEEPEEPEDDEEPEEEGAICGNNVCDGNEDFLNCEKDCSSPVCGNNICEITENLYNCPEDCETEKSISEMSEYQLIRYLDDEITKTDPTEIAKQCTSIKVGKLKDSCFYYLTKNTNSSYYCTLIDDSNKKDDCYVSYSYNTNDYEKCSDIKDKFKKEHCDSLKISYSIQLAYI